jgi:hypothetical protein
VGEACRYCETTEEIDNSLRQVIGIVPKWRVGRPPALSCVSIRGIRANSCPNRKRQSSENQEEPMMVCADSLKLLLGELDASPIARRIALSRFS